MIIDFLAEKPLSRYHLLTQTVIPRPIAWVLSENEDNSLNLAPFSFFNAMCSDPPLLVMSIGKKPDGALKDTRRNIISGRDFVVHIASVEQAAEVTSSAAVLDYGESEVVKANLPTEDFPGCAVPRLQNCPVAYHCRLYDMHEIGPNKQGIIYAEVQQLYMNDDIVEVNNNRFTIDAKKIDPLSRLGGAQYTSIDRVFEIQRPK